MPEQARVGDLVICGKGAIGVWVTGSPDTFCTLTQPMVRKSVDIYVCPHCTGIAVGASPDVHVNSQRTHRKGDSTVDCDGPGVTITGSHNVLIN
jgi:uncharacterized Zn-binding protein involved in type VI secretion